jgi:outer membrane protein
VTQKTTKHLLLILLLISAVMQARSADQVFDHDMAGTIAWLFENNRDYQNSLAELEKARMDVVEATSSALPTVFASMTATKLGEIQTVKFQEDDSAPNEQSSAELETAYENDYRMNLQLNQLLFSGSVFYAIGVSRAYKTVAENQLRKDKLDLLSEFLKSYSQVRLLRELVNLNQEIVEQTKAHYEDAKLLNQIGSLSRFDLLRNEVEYMNSIPDLREATDNLNSAENVLRLMLSLPAGTEIVIHDFTISDSILEEISANATYKNSNNNHLNDGFLTTLNSQALNNRPEASITTSSITGYKRAVGVYRTNGWPTLAAFANIDRSNSWDMFQQKVDWHTSWNTGLSLNIPIFAGFKNNSQVQKAKQDLKKAKNNDSSMRDAIQLEVERALDELYRRQLDHSAWSRNVEAAAEGLKISLLRSESGNGSELELRDARTAMKAARVNLVQADFTLLKAQIDLLYAVGKLDQAEFKTSTNNEGLNK